MMASKEVVPAAAELDSETDEWKVIQEEITCSICSEFFTEPKTLSCMHTFCEKCIKLNIQTCTQLGNEVCCPICRARLPALRVVASIPTNFSMQRFIDAFKKRQKSLQQASYDIRCGECKDNALAVMWCADCERLLCQKCYNPHTRMNMYQSHKTMTKKDFMKNPKWPKDTLQYCEEHITQDLALYCKTCNCLICRDCTIVDHKHHNYNFVTKLIDDESKKIQTAVTTLIQHLDQVRNSLIKLEGSYNDLNNETDIEKQIRETYEYIHRILVQEEAENLQKVSTAKTALKLLLNKQKETLRNLDGLLVGCNTYISRITIPGNGQLLIHSKNIIQRVTDLTDQIKQTTLDPECGADHLVLSTASRDDCAGLFSFVCAISTLPHALNCIVKGPQTMSQYCPVHISVTLKDKDGFTVPKQGNHLTLQFKDNSITGHVIVEENQKHIYLLSYKPRRMETHDVKVVWKETLLQMITVPVCIRDYAAVQQEKNIISKYGPDNKDVYHPHLLALGLNNELIVRDYASQHLIVFNSQLQYSHTIGEGKLCRPTGIVVDKGGHLLVADRKLHAILKFTMNGAYISTFGSKGSGCGEFQGPRGLLLTTKELLFVCDKDNHRIQVLKDEKYFYSFGQLGEEPGYFNCPINAALNTPENLLFVSEYDNHRVQIFTPSGQFLKVFGNFTNFPYEMKRLSCVYYTPDGHILISSFDTNQVFIFTEDGTFVSAIEGTYQGRIGFSKPIGVVMMDDGRIVIAGNETDNLVVL